MAEYEVTVSSKTKVANGKFKSKLRFKEVHKLIASFIKGNLEEKKC